MTKKQKKSQRFVGAVFFAAGLGAIVWTGTDFQRGWASKDWPRSKGLILSSTVESLSQDASRSSVVRYKPVVEYSYIVNGKQYEADTVAFGRMPGYLGTAHTTVNSYPKGGNVLVAHHPTRPQIGVLEPGVSWTSLALLVVGIGCAGMGAGVLVSLARSRKMGSE